jgi:hypothetical protein
VYSGSQDGAVRATHLNEYNCLASMEGHQGSVHAVLVKDEYLYRFVPLPSGYPWGLRGGSHGPVSGVCSGSRKCSVLTKVPFVFPPRGY